MLVLWIGIEFAFPLIIFFKLFVLRRQWNIIYSLKNVSDIRGLKMY